MADVLNCYDQEFADFALGFAAGKYALWLGSGISREVVPNVYEMLKGLLEFLRQRIDASAPDCRHRRALKGVLDAARVPQHIQTGCDVGIPVASWPVLHELLDFLVDRYSEVLDVNVEGEEEDFLVWEGLDLVRTYGSSSLQPDVEHLCVAILMLEGVVTTAPTTNWDGLVEGAMDALTGCAESRLSVVVQREDFASTCGRPELVKFHGCARRAGDNPGTYRSLLIARKIQISGWTTRAENRLMKNYLEQLLATKSAFFVGLSAQDANIHTILHEANTNLAKNWPSSPPAVVFAEQALSSHHEHTMKVTYGSSTYNAQTNPIRSSALLGAFAKPALLGLVLFTLTNKLIELVRHLFGTRIPQTEVESLCGYLRDLRNTLGFDADQDVRSFTERLVAGLSLTLSSFRTGKPPQAGASHYQPLSDRPIDVKIALDPDFPTQELGRLAVALAMLQRGAAERGWRLSIGDVNRFDDGVFKLTSPVGVGSKVYGVRDAKALEALQVSGIVDLNDSDVVLIEAQTPPRAAQRSSRGNYGRTGKKRARRIDLDLICAKESTADDLFNAFAQGGAF